MGGRLVDIAKIADRMYFPSYLLYVGDASYLIASAFTELANRSSKYLGTYFYTWPYLFQ